MDLQSDIRLLDLFGSFIDKKVKSNRAAMAYLVRREDQPLL